MKTSKDDFKLVQDKHYPDKFRIVNTVKLEWPPFIYDVGEIKAVGIFREPLGGFPLITSGLLSRKRLVKGDTAILSSGALIFYID